MILPISMNFSSLNIRTNTTKQNDLNINSTNSLKLSGYNNPMKSYISFGYCEKNGGHYQHMYEIDEKFSQKIAEKIEEIEKLKNTPRTRLSLEDESNMQAAKIMMQYSNMQTTFAEMPPAYTIVTGAKLKEVMDRTQTYTNPVNNLIIINNITKITGANPDLPESRQGKATRAAQLYSTLILLDLIRQNKGEAQFAKTEKEIDELVAITEKTIKSIYGDDIFERVQKLSKMGRKVSVDNQRMALDFLIEIDCVSKKLELPSEFEEKLSRLVDKQNDLDGRTVTAQQPEKKLSKTIKVFYPNHEHTMEHLNGTPHTHAHEHHHDHDSEYKTILDNMHSKQSKVEKENIEEQEKKKIIKGE